MALKVKDFAEYIERKAPLKFQESYDNAGLSIGDKEADIKRILVALDVTLDVIEEAKEKKVDLIFSHHPLLFLKPGSITMDTLQGKKIIELIRNHINVYSAHTNLDSVKGGLNDIIVELLGFKDASIIESSKEDNESGIGRVVKLDNQYTVKDVCRFLKMKLHVPFLKVIGDMNDAVNAAAIINGSGQSYFKAAKSMGADLIITGDTSYHYVSDYREMGISIIDISHFSCEWPLFKKFVNDIEDDIKAMDSGIEILFSEKSRDPYSVY